MSDADIYSFFNDLKMQIFFIGIVLFFGIIFFKLFKKKTPADKGEVDRILSTLGSEYNIYREIVLQSQGGMSHIDFVVASRFGVFVIDIRSETEDVYGDINELEWRLGKRETIYNPVWRNRVHMNGLENLIGKMAMIPVVVFRKGILKSDFGANVIEQDKMLEFIRSQLSDRVSYAQLKFIDDILKPNAIPENLRE